MNRNIIICIFVIYNYFRAGFVVPKDERLPSILLPTPAACSLTSLLGRSIRQEPQNAQQARRWTRIVGALRHKLPRFVQRKLHQINQFVFDSATAGRLLCVRHLAVVHLLEGTGSTDARPIRHDLLDVGQRHIVSAFLLDFLTGDLDEGLGFVYDSGAQFQRDTERDREAVGVDLVAHRQGVADDAIVDSWMK